MGVSGNIWRQYLRANVAAGPANVTIRSGFGRSANEAVRKARSPSFEGLVNPKGFRTNSKKLTGSTRSWFRFARKLAACLPVVEMVSDEWRMSTCLAAASLDAAISRSNNKAANSARRTRQRCMVELRVSTADNYADRMRLLAGCLLSLLVVNP